MPSTSKPTHLPYAFSNFVWWSDDDLRAQLKKRIPGLGDEITPTNATESRLRDALKTLLREKGIVADVMSEDPSPFELTVERVPEAPGPAIVFSILNPQILVDHVIVSGAPDAEIDALNQSLKRTQGRKYSTRYDWNTRREVEEQLRQDGYLEAHAEVGHDKPRHEGEHYFVNLIVATTPGSQYHIAAITADGGPLLNGRDLSSLIKTKPGDVAIPNPWAEVPGELRSLYEHSGYAGVAIEDPPILDREHALVSYHLTVTPGPLYHLRSLTIHNLDAGQESKARRMLGLQPGDTFDELAISALSNKLRVDSSLSGYSFTYNPAKDKSVGTVDLTLDFFNNSDQPSVTTH
jgi:outer membrane protein insertion porin family